MKEEPLETLQSVCTRVDILALQKQAKEIYIHPVLLDYMIDLVQATRSWPNIDMGVSSPRGSLALVRAVRALTPWCAAAHTSMPEDIKTVAVPVLAHRLQLSGSVGSTDAQKKAMTDVLSSVALPTEDWSKNNGRSFCSPIVLLVLYFLHSAFLFRRLWDKNLTVQISFLTAITFFCGEEANLVETIVNNKYLPLPVFGGRLRYEPLGGVSGRRKLHRQRYDLPPRRVHSVRAPAHHAYTTCPRQKSAAITVSRPPRSRPTIF